VGERGLDHAVRRDPQLRLPLDQRDGRGDGGVAHHLPGVLAADQEELALLAADRLHAAAARRVVRLGAHPVLASGRRLVVDRARQALDVEARPRLARRLALPGLEEHAAGVVLDRFQSRLAQRLGDRLDAGLAVLGVRDEGNEERERGQRRDDVTHAWPPDVRWGAGMLHARAVLGKRGTVRPVPRPAGPKGAPVSTPRAATSAREEVRKVAPKLIEMTEKVVYGDVWERPGLSKRDRSLITVAALIAMYRGDQLTGHLERALPHGVTKGEIGEGITHMALYAGRPTGV